MESSNIINKTIYYIEIESYCFDYDYLVLYCYSYPSSTENFTFNVTFNIKSSIKLVNNKNLEVIKEHSFIAWNIINYSLGYRQYSGYFDINFTNDTDSLYELHLTKITKGSYEEDKNLTYYNNYTKVSNFIVGGILLIILETPKKKFIFSKST